MEASFWDNELRWILNTPLNEFMNHIRPFSIMMTRRTCDSCGRAAAEELLRPSNTPRASHAQPGAQTIRLQLPVLRSSVYDAHASSYIHPCVNLQCVSSTHRHYNCLMYAVVGLNVSKEGNIILKRQTAGKIFKRIESPCNTQDFVHTWRIPSSRLVSIANS